MKKKIRSKFSAIKEKRFAFDLLGAVKDCTGWLCQICKIMCNGTSRRTFTWNYCFAILDPISAMWRFKIVSARCRPAPGPFPFASVTVCMLHSTLLSLCVFPKPGCTKTLPLFMRLLPDWTDALFMLAVVTDTPINNSNNIKRLYSALPMVMAHGRNDRSFSWLNRICSEEKIWRIRGKVRLAHSPRDISEQPRRILHPPRRTFETYEGSY